MNGRILDRVYDAIRNLECSQGCRATVSSLMALSDIDLGYVPETKRDQLLQKICATVNGCHGPLLILSLPQNTRYYA